MQKHSSTSEHGTAKKVRLQENDSKNINNCLNQYEAFMLINISVFETNIRIGWKCPHCQSKLKIFNVLDQRKGFANLQMQKHSSTSTCPYTKYLSASPSFLIPVHTTQTNLNRIFGQKVYSLPNFKVLLRPWYPQYTFCGT